MAQQRSKADSFVFPGNHTYAKNFFQNFFKGTVRVASKLEEPAMRRCLHGHVTEIWLVALSWPILRKFQKKMLLCKNSEFLVRTNFFLVEGTQFMIRTPKKPLFTENSEFLRRSIFLWNFRKIGQLNATSHISVTWPFRHQRIAGSSSLEPTLTVPLKKILKKKFFA